MEVFHEFSIEAAHRLPHVPPEHPCARMHGHSWRIAVHVAGDVDERTGWVVDYAVLEAAFDSVRADLDHRVLNDVPGLANPTSENLARWLWRRLEPRLSGLSRIDVRETARSGCVLRREDLASAAGMRSR
jgi:6-pyruvoyltetrahydropterin/6-carboxytetrahydropterin synthase